MDTSLKKISLVLGRGTNTKATEEIDIIPEEDSISFQFLNSSAVNTIAKRGRVGNHDKWEGC